MIIKDKYDTEGRNRMKKIAITTDSNTGITQAEARELGIYVLPMPFTINGKTYFEDISLTQSAFYKYLAEDADISTSQPAVGDVLDFWNKILEEYDEIIHFPMSSGLSGTCSTAMMLAQDFDGRVYVVDNQHISVTQRHSIMDAQALIEKGYESAQIKQILERDRAQSSIYIMVDTLKYLKKGGRVTPAAAAIGTMFNIKPVLQIQGGKLDAFAKVRGLHQAKKLMLDTMVKDFETRIPGGIAGGGARIAIAHTQNDDEAMVFKQELLAVAPWADIIVEPLSLSVSCHTGPGVLACGWTRNLPELEDQA
jgi:DegV family protein with EDD domain